jgi:hypothetical protein
VTPSRALYPPAQRQGSAAQPVTLVDLLDRLLAGGVVVHGQITLAAADIDLVDVDLALLVAATAKVAAR